MKIYGMAKALWLYRDFVFGSVRLEFQARYLRSLFGAGWAIAHPLVLILVYTIIFSQIMRAKLPQLDSSFAYGIYICAGLLPWTYFSETINRMQGVFIENGNLIKKARFPKASLPAIVLLSASANFAIIFVLFLAFLFVTNNFPGWIIFAVLPVLIVQIMLAVGLGLLLGTLNVFFRDVGHMTGIFLQLLFWLTPIVYPIGIVPFSVQAWLHLNPMTPLIAAYQRIFVYAALPEWGALILPVLIAVAFLWGGYTLFKARYAEILDEV